ncbi:ALF repeat-containing protein [Paenarthrobacter nitroguajacolicus]|uniref:ALF repeat-containing protein n=1 Tax=Paenarthrobacter nitroguajacolicus TaxID=211146 RepID=UPI00248B4C40|nr:ALF repeat-containing protein [Paenarthrobacter nitroguajacolicus]MDI2034348.1 hypothetical protein [Paenarthrobacter nitroguajacolicus]
MISVIRATRRRWAAAVVAVVVGASLLFAAPAQAYDVPNFEVPNASQAPVPFVERVSDAAGVVELWKTGGPATRTAAAAALVGGADAVQAFLDGGQDVALAADRKQLVTELTTRGSEHVRSSAAKVLASNNPALINEFLAVGWGQTWRGDLRTAATYFLDYGNVHVARAASESLDNGDAAVEKFVLEGWRAKVFMTDRQAAYAVLASSNAAVSAAAEAALNTGDGAVVADFLRYGQFVVADHDAESSAVSAVLQQVKTDIASNPAGAAGVADRANTAVEKARNTAASARTADETRLLADWKFLSAQAKPRGAADNAQLASEKPLRKAFAAAAQELPVLLATLTAVDADLEALIVQARQATLDLSLVGTPEVRKAAETALAGGDDAIKSFIAVGNDAAFELDGPAELEDRQRVAQLQATGGEYVFKAASEAGKSTSHAIIRYFLEYGHAVAQELDNQILAFRSIDQGGLEVRAAANVGLDGSRADLQTFATVGKAAAAGRDQATATHVASIDAMITELAGLANQATVDAGKAADAAKAAEAARQAEAAAEAARQAAAGGQVAAGSANASQESATGAAPIVIPWPREYTPAVGLAETGAAEKSAATPSAAPSISVPPAASAAKGSTSVDSQSQEAAAPLATSATGMSAWTIGLIVALVLAAAGAITFLLRRKGAASA